MVYLRQALHRAMHHSSISTLTFESQRWFHCVDAQQFIVGCVLFAVFAYSCYCCFHHLGVWHSSHICGPVYAAETATGTPSIDPGSLIPGNAEQLQEYAELQQAMKQLSAASSTDGDSSSSSSRRSTSSLSSSSAGGAGTGSAQLKAFIRDFERKDWQVEDLICNTAGTM